jgi:hypothetical protein
MSGPRADLRCASQTSPDDDVLADIVDIANDIVVPEAQDDPAILLQTLRPYFIICGRIHFGMLRAIHFDDQFPFRASEVDYVASDRKLSAEPKPHQLMRANLVPKLQFCIGRLFASTWRLRGVAETMACAASSLLPE